MSSPIDLNTLFSLDGRVALVTGAGSGIGSYIAHAFALAGAERVYITGRRLEALQKTATLHKVIVPIQGDVSSKAGCAALVKAFEEAESLRGISGPARLDVLVNNAGIITKDGTWDKDGANVNVISRALLEADDDEWAKGFAVNTSSIQWMSASFLPHLERAAANGGKAQGRGNIINNTSISALYVSRDSQLHLYTATKAAAESISQNLASKFTKLGVRVNSIAMGNIPSEINDLNNPNSFISKFGYLVPIGRVGNEEDITGAVLYLASRAGSFVSGAMLKLDGGILVGV
ncbi:NAD(P)-binding protein [Peniophora sp. CONT]|nr:NAD(P)-binding protein [Peniophora sp. CONT]